MTSVNLVYRPSTKKGRHPGSLSLRVIHRRRNKTVTLPDCHVFCEEWDKERQRIIYPRHDPDRMVYLEEVESRLKNAVDFLAGFISELEKKGRYTVEEVLALFREKKDENKLSGYTERLARELERHGQYRTARAYRTVTRGIVRFNKGEDIPLQHINACLIKDFEVFLRDNGRSPNTISYYMRNLRAIYNKAVSERRILHRTDGKPFAGVYTGVTKTMKRALTLDEIRALHDFDIPALLKEKNPFTGEYEALKSLYDAQRYFAFCFNARGMCFIDLAYLQKNNIRGGILRYVHKKTGQQIEVKLTTEMNDIISSFSDETAETPYVFPIIRDMEKNLRLQYENGLRTQNIRLKKLAALVGIKKPLSTHWARHSWANIGKQENIPLRVISECLGHTSERTTLIYLDQLDNSLLDAANERVTAAILRPVMAGSEAAAGVSPG